MEYSYNIKYECNWPSSDVKTMTREKCALNRIKCIMPMNISIICDRFGNALNGMMCLIQIYA